MTTSIMTLFLHQYQVGPMENFSYLLADETTREAAYIDPGWEVEKVLRKAQEQNLRITACLLTHTHFDHVQELAQLLEHYAVPVYVHEKEREKIAPPAHLIQETKERTEIRIGSLSVLCHHTPGHSPGSQCFEIEHHLITGDTLFVGACGRVDLPGSDPHDMMLSLQKLSAFREEIIIYPGHNYGATATSTIGHEKNTNPFLRAAMAGKVML